MKGFAALGALVSIALPAGLSTQNARAAHALAPTTWPPIERSSRLLARGRVRCTASAPSVVEVGQALEVRIGLHNVSKRPVTISLWVFSATVALKAGDGTTYDSGGELQGLTIPPPVPRKLRAGGWLRLGPVRIPVRWPGTLRVAPHCLGKTLRTLQVAVAPTSPSTDENAAVAEVVAASGHLLDQCRPLTPGVAVNGTIQPPSGAPPMDAQCSVSISSEGQFSIAQVLVLTPPGLTGVRIYQPYETLWPPGSFVGLPASPPYEAIAWEFVVTQEKAIPVAAATLSASCGSTSFAAGGTSPELESISVCS